MIIEDYRRNTGKIKIYTCLFSIILLLTKRGAKLKYHWTQLSEIICLMWEEEREIRNYENHKRLNELSMRMVKSKLVEQAGIDLHRRCNTTDEEK